MTFTLEHLLSILSALGALLAALFAMGRILLNQVEKRLDERFGAMERIRQESSDAWRTSFSALEAAYHQTDQRLTQLQVDLPLQYQRREDAIRQEVTIIHRLDGIATKVELALRCDRGSCPLRVPHAEAAAPNPEDPYDRAAL